MRMGMVYMQMPVDVYVYQVVFLQKVLVDQYLLGFPAADDGAIAAENVNDVRDFLYNVQVVRGHDDGATQRVRVV